MANSTKIPKKVAGLNPQGSTLSTPVTPGSGYKPAALTGTGTGSSSTRVGSSAHFDRPDYNTTTAIANNIYQSLMGRNATQAEIAKYHQDYIRYAASHPTSTSSSMSSSSSVNAVGNISTTQSGGSSSSSGLNESDFISNLASGQSEAKDYMAATTYMDAMKSAMNRFGGGY